MSKLFIINYTVTWIVSEVDIPWNLKIDGHNQCSLSVVDSVLLLSIVNNSLVTHGS